MSISILHPSSNFHPNCNVPHSFHAFPRAPRPKMSETIHTRIYSPPTHCMNSPLLTPRHKLQIRVKSMQFHLINTRQNLRTTIDQSLQCLLRKIANPNAPTPRPHQPLHHLPRLQKRRTFINPQIRLAPIFLYTNGVRPMHQEDIDVSQAKRGEGFFECENGVVMPFSPELCHDCDF